MAGPFGKNKGVMKLFLNHRAVGTQKMGQLSVAQGNGQDDGNSGNMKSFGYKNTSRRTRNVFCFSLAILFFIIASHSICRAEQVVLPLTLDYKLLTSLLVREAFSGKGQTAALVGRPGECVYLGISEPKFSAAGKNVRLEMRLAIRLGTDVVGRCVAPVEWQGYLSLVQQPVFDSQTFSLAFRTVDSIILNQARQPATIAGVLWEFAKPRVYEYLNRVRLNLAPPVKDMRDFLAPLFHEQARQATQTMLSSLRGGPLSVTGDSVIIELQGEVEEVYSPAKDQGDKTISQAERKKLIQLWETWDVFLVSLVSLLASEPLTPEDQLLLVDVLLDTRYAFAAALEEQDLEKDFVRLQFIRVWRKLAPLFRRQLYAKPSANTLGFLAFFTAADALTVLDQMGPTLGIEVSQQGLLRLAAMLTGRETPLIYSPDVDPGLRKLLQLPAVESRKKIGNEDDILEIDLPPTKKEKEPVDSGLRQLPQLPPVETEQKMRKEDGILETDLPIIKKEKDPVDSRLRKLPQLPPVETEQKMRKEDGILETDLPIIKKEKDPVDSRLRKLPQLPPVEDRQQTGDEDEILEIDLPKIKEDKNPLSRLSNFFFTPAYALDAPLIAEALNWKVPEDDLTGYAERVRTVLADASSFVLAKQQIPTQLHAIFRTMIVAMAWQESCFRQFVEKNNKLTFLMSYNQTSVGVMQINERVWRGMYDRNQLRWDIRYNAQAGCEIAELYLRRYALQGNGPAPGAKVSSLPGIVYAMYNGGPGQYEKYLAREKSGKPFPSDQYFAEKLKWVEKREWGQIRECLGGG
jgi:hypothetical protein